MVPTVGMPGHAVRNPLLSQTMTCVVQGWKGEVISVDNAIEFAKFSEAELHLIEADHRLTTVLPTVGHIFEDFLFRAISA